MKSYGEEENVEDFQYITGKISLLHTWDVKSKLEVPRAHKVVPVIPQSRTSNTTKSYQ